MTTVIVILESSAI